MLWQLLQGKRPADLRRGGCDVGRFEVTFILRAWSCQLHFMDHIKWHHLSSQGISGNFTWQLLAICRWSKHAALWKGLTHRRRKSFMIFMLLRFSIQCAGKGLFALKLLFLFSLWSLTQNEPFQLQVAQQCGTHRHSVVVAAYEGLEQTWHPMVDFL